MHIRVGVIDTGVTIAHKDLHNNIAINQGEIPSWVDRARLDTDHDGLITFYDLNDPNNKNNPDVPGDWNNNKYIDAEDLLHSSWINGVDEDRFSTGQAFVDDLVGWNFEDHNNDPSDQDGHGTAVAGILGAEANNYFGMAGTAWRVSMVPIRVDQHVAATSKGSVPDVKFFDALAYAQQLGVDIVQMSMGITVANSNATSVDVCAMFFAGPDNPKPNPNPPFLNKDPDAFQAAEEEYQKAFQQAPYTGTRTLFVHAAQNSSMNLSDPNVTHLPAKPMKAVLGKNVLIVGNCYSGMLPGKETQCNVSDPTSNYSQLLHSSDPVIVELWAPGRAWISTVTSGLTSTEDKPNSPIVGTSFSAPVVSGAAVLALAGHLGLQGQAGVAAFLHDTLVETSTNSINYTNCTNGLVGSCMCTNIMNAGPALDVLAAVQ